MTALYHINEIFYSIQGEGYWTGQACVFVRFSGCNLTCKWCDTAHHDTNIRVDVNEFIQRVSGFASRHIVLTGGEPTMQLTPSLLNRLHDAGWYIHIETNGTRMVPKTIDWITVSPKPGATWTQRHANELKIIYMGQQDVELEWYQQEAECSHYFLQPCSTQNTLQTLQKVLECPQWNLSTQMHKHLCIP